MKIKYYFLLSMLVISAAFTLARASSAPVKALDEPTELTNVVAYIYPEYDDALKLNTPSLLVRLQGEVGGVTLPTTIRFLVPTTAFMYSAGSLDGSGRYVNLFGAPVRIPSAEVEGWDEISTEITNSTFIMEYYDPVIGVQPDKTINYEFRPLYPITDLKILVQEPLTSSNFSVDPVADSKFISTDSFSGRQFSFHQYNRNDLATGDVITFNITYTKSDLAPSVENANSGSSGISSIVWIILGVLVLIAIGIYFALRIKSNKRKSKRIDRRARMAGPSKKKRLRARFCAQCRQPLESSDAFCPGCGAKRN